MDKSTFIITILSLSILLAPQIKAQSETNSGTRKEADEPEIVVTKLDISDKNLNLCYEIRNDSTQDVWILAGTTNSSVDACVFKDEDGRTLRIRQRLNVPTRMFFNVFYGRYVRLRAGKTQPESVSLTVPIYPQHGLEGGRQERGIEYATRLAIEIGYYSGDLPRMISNILEKAEKIGNEIGDDADDLRYIKKIFGGFLYFNKCQESLTQRDEEILIPYTHQALKGEKILCATVDGLRIPYEDKEDLSERHPPDLTSCTRVEIRYQPSILEHFFPYVGQQGILSTTEIEYLRSEKTVILDDPKELGVFLHDISEGVSATGVVRQRRMAHVVCYSDGELLMSFPIYNDTSIVIEGKRFIYFNGFPSLKILTPQIQPIELRVQCADTLRDLHSWLGLYYKIEEIEKTYPPSNKWCDDIIRAYQSLGKLRKDAKPLKCPSVPEGKCHYAMNPNCKWDSPPDMVLLFETKSGWNQHGGPELFTFDNHDPKGGCVLLNDGTVKFIRTTEQLRQLRWK